MYKYILKRLLMMIPVLLGVTFIIFTLLYITPGDPARILLGETARQADIDELRREMGLDQPFIIQFWNYITNALRGDLGTSFVTRRPVMVEILERFPTTLLLAALSVGVAVLIGVPFGIIAATKQYSLLDNFTSFFCLVGVSMPNFWQGLMLIIIFSVTLGWLPASGFYGPVFWILPALTVGTTGAAVIMRFTRSSMLEVIRQDYIRTSRAKGNPEYITINKHALHNALIPVVTVIGLQLGFSLGGAVLTESIFSIPGLGRLMVDSIRARNFPVIQGGVLFIALAFSFVNLAVDVLYAFFDPRIKSQYTSKSKAVTQKNKTETAEKEAKI